MHNSSVRESGDEYGEHLVLKWMQNKRIRVTVILTYQHLYKKFLKLIVYGILKKKYPNLCEYFYGSCIFLSQFLYLKDFLEFTWICETFGVSPVHESLEMLSRNTYLKCKFVKWKFLELFQNIHWKSITKPQKKTNN